jgi:hypothetical protein
MHWRELRGFYFPLCMEEISKVKSRYTNLVQQIQKTNLEKDRKAYLELRKSIEQRIAEIDNFIEENFEKQYVLHFEKCKLKLKKLLQITPKEKLSKHSNKNFRDIDVLNKVIKQHQGKEKEKEILKNKNIETPIYNQLPVDYTLYEGLIEDMKIEDIKNKNYLNPNKKYLGDITISNETQSQDNSFNKSKNSNFKNFRISFGNNSNNIFLSNNSEKTDTVSKYLNSKKINEK